MFIEISVLIFIGLLVVAYAYHNQKNYRELKKRYDSLEVTFEKFVDHINNQKRSLDEYKFSFVKSMAGLDNFQMVMPPDDEVYEDVFNGTLQKMSEHGFDKIRLRYYKFRDVQHGRF